MLTVVCCCCWNLQRLAVDVLTTVCCLNHSACGRRVRQRLLAESKSSSGVVDRPLISAVSGACRTTTTHLRPLLSPPSERQIHRRSFGNSGRLLREKLDAVLNDRTAGAKQPLPLGSGQVHGTIENTADDGGAEIVTKRRFIAGRSDDADNVEDDHEIEEKPNDATEMDHGGRRTGSERKAVDFSTPIHSMLVVVTADMVAATAQIGEGGRDDIVASTTTMTQGGTASCSDTANDGCSAHAAESLSDIPLSTPPTLTEDLSNAVAAAGQA